MPRDAGFGQALCSNMNGFSLYAAARCGTADRQALELKLMTAWHGSTTRRVMLPPLDFMQRAAALVPQSASRRRFRACECR
jgi:hypothetical protein